VDVASNVAPSSIVMNNSGANDYVISASTGAIIGPASFTKSGGAKLTISGVHAFTGPFAINGGIVSTAIVNDQTVPGPLGQGALIFSGGVLEYTGLTATATRSMEFAAGGGTVNIPDLVDLTFAGSIIGTGGLTKTGGGTLALSGSNGFDGPVLVSAGVLKLGNSNSLGTGVGGTTVSAGATLDLAAITTAMALSQDEIITASGPGLDLDGDTIADGALVNFGTADAQNALKKVVLAGDTTFGGTRRFDIRIAGSAGAGFVAGTDAYLKGNGFSLTKVGPAQLGIAGVGETNLGDININSGMVIFHDAGNGDAAMMLASDTTLGRLDDGAGNFYKVTIEAGATLQFFNSDGTRSKDIVANGVGTNAIIHMGSNVDVAHTLTLDRGITVNGGLTLNSASANDTTLRITGVISEGTSIGSITKIGGGAVVLTNANTFTGGVALNAGFLRVGDNAALGSGPLTLNGGGLSSIGNAPRQITNPVSVTANTTLGDATNNGVLTFASRVDLGNVARNLTVNSDVTFAAGFTAIAPGGLNQKLGAGTLTIGAGASTTGGVTEVRNGNLVLENGASLSSGDAVRVMANTAGGTATFTMNPGSSILINAATANFRVGHEAVTITDGRNIANIAGNFAFSAASTAGRIQLGSDSAFAQLNLLTGGTITARNIGLGVQTPVGAVTEFNFDGGTLRPFVNNSAFFNAVLTAANVKVGGGTIDTNGFDIGIVQPLLHDPALGMLPDGGMTKAGAGTLTFNGVNTYTGPTIVNGGTLDVSASSSIASSEITTVNPAGTLSGSGTIAALALNGGTLAPGSGIGTLTALDYVDFAGGTVAFEINGLNPGTDYDQFAASESGGSVITISAPTELSLSLGFTPTLGDTFVLIKNNSGALIDTDSLFTFGGAAVPDGGEFNVNGTTFALHYDGGDGNDLTIVAVPEPASAWLLLGGLGFLSFQRRRRA
jgi:fibronectin-binding autotransporter adhesin